MNRFVRTLALAALSAGACGCAAYTRAEMSLVTQARQGVALVAQQDDQRDRAIREAAKLRREKLDAAFDADVQLRATQETLDPDWVIEARRAYAVAVDSYVKAQAADERAAKIRRRNLAAIDAALGRLAWMQSVRLRLDPLNPEETNPSQEGP